MWRKKDILWLRQNYPGLNKKGKNIIEGRISFQMIHAGGKHFISPNSEEVAIYANEDNYICDTYSIRIEWLVDKPYPIVQEISSKINNSAEKFGF